jgi:AcrR family transcriptional regulator
VDPPGRKPSLTVEKVVAAAIEVIDESGVGGLSMRRVAEHLGTGAASLYVHVSGREELLELVFDDLVGRVPLPEADPTTWREQLHQMMRDLHEVLASHRDAALAGLGRIPTSPKTIAASEAVVAAMLAGDLDNQTAALGFDLLILFVSASAFEYSLWQQSLVDEAEMQRYFSEVHGYYAALPENRFPALAQIADDLIGFGSEDRFDFAVDVIIAGLEARTARKRAPE